jgi:2-phospho-L-lactate/phosphoenolpyruvate guanylyltransferase
MAFWLLIPIKSLQAGKSRLSSFLDDQVRRYLNEFFLRHIVEVARELPGSHGTAIISECEGVLGLARSLDIRAIRQTAGQGLNAAATQGVDELRASGACAILIIASDPPMIRASDLHEIATRGREHRVVICPDKHYTGTNAIFLAADTSLHFRFGAESCAEHCREAQSSGITPLTYFHRRIAMDIDVPADVQPWLGEQLLGLCDAKTWKARMNQPLWNKGSIQLNTTIVPPNATARACYGHEGAPQNDQAKARDRRRRAAQCACLRCANCGIRRLWRISGALMAIPVAEGCAFRRS